ncbi:S8/S53 family peptidase [Cellulomonas sp. Sa3CUA2]|uniref:S8/S53 family peptidase n=1 Tax=Cellulomonas avistercoris TaxID=2762242 RepID=A0ABR8QCX4_9CELL|nr:S8/S53 family peptidase [Cellulomonas avistercoris]MBD7918288.1 S8/S53 family peptidase [Cellulomonas avistercoris]
MSVYRTDPPSLGRPFGRDYAPAAVGLAADPAVRRAVARQAAELARHSDDAGVRGRGDVIRERVRGRWLRGERRVDVVRGAQEDEKALIVGGEVLVSMSSWPDVADEAARDGLTRVDVGCTDLEDRVVRLRADGEDSQARLTRFVDDLRAQGHAVSFSYVTPLSPVMKGCAGVPAPGLATFADYGPVDPSFGRGVRVAVIDTGIVEAPRRDGWLSGVARVPDGAATGSNIDHLDADPADGYLDVSAGHGTFVAGIVAQVAPGAEITVHRVLTTSGTATDVDVACALIRAVRENAQIVNLSLGTETHRDEAPLALAAAFDVVREIEMARGWETVVVAAGGNGGTTSPVWPAAFGRVVSVGGLTAGLRPSTWSSRGHWIDVSAVGEGIVSTYVAGAQSPDLAADPQTFTADPWARWTGTSFAAPQVSGAIARAMTEHSLSATQAVQALLAAGKPVAGFGRALQILPGA